MVKAKGTTSQRCEAPRRFNDRGGIAITSQRYKYRDLGAA